MGQMAQLSKRAAWKSDRRSYTPRGWHAVLVLFLILCLGAMLPSANGQEGQGYLEEVRPAIRSNDSPADESPEPERRPDRQDGYNLRVHAKFHYGSDDNPDDDCRDELEAELFWIAAYIAASPWWAPPCVLGDDYSRPGYFPRYPYEGDNRGSMYFSWDGESKPPVWSLRATGVYGTDFSDVTQLGGRFQADWFRFGIDSEYRRLEEELPGGDIDHASAGDLNLVFRFAQSRRVQMRSGLGVNWFDDATGSDFGFNFTYGGDWFPDDPFVISFDFDWGRIGDASLIHGRLTGGVLFRNAETFAGYDFIEIGDAPLHSLIAGVRLWF